MTLNLADPAARRIAVQRCHAAGWTQLRIAEALNIATSTVADDLGALGLTGPRQPAGVSPDRVQERGQRQPAGTTVGLGPLLSRLREAHGWSLRELADHCGSSSASPLFMLERDQVNLSPDRCSRLARAFNVPPAILRADVARQRGTWTLTGHPILLAAVRIFARRIGVGVEVVASAEETDPKWDMTPDAT